MSNFNLGVFESEQPMPDRDKLDPGVVHYGPKYAPGADCHWCAHRTDQMMTDGGDCEIMKGIVKSGYACDVFTPRRPDGGA